MSRLEHALRLAIDELQRAGKPAALVGGLAVSALAEPRFTRDIDLAVAVEDDREAEALVRTLARRGYAILATVEQSARGRLATVRLSSPAEDDAGVVLDLLFASSGIEPEVVAAAEPIEVFPRLSLPVARAGHLLALKVLARDDRRRPQDRIDAMALLDLLSDEEARRARGAVKLIKERGFNRDRDVVVELEVLLEAGKLD